MNEYDVKRLAEVLAIQAEIEGMKLDNLQREQDQLAYSYTLQAFYDKAEELRVIADKYNAQWRFYAYKTAQDFKSHNYYFKKDFSDHTKMKIFSSAHSKKEELLHKNYCSTYLKLTAT